MKDLEETFVSLYKVNLKLNPAKCVFGVRSGKLLGFSCLTEALRQTQTRSRP